MSFERIENARGGRLAADEAAASCRLLTWLADAFWDVPSAWLASEFPDGEAGLLASRLASMAQATACVEELFHADEDALRAARVEYTALFCSTDDGAPFPYESVYHTQERLLMRPSRDDVVACYEAAGYRPAQGDGNEPEDHLSIQLRFLAALTAVEGGIADARVALADMSSEEARRMREDFAAEHVRSWLPRFSEEVEARARSPLYPALTALAVELTELLAYKSDRSHREDV